MTESALPTAPRTLPLRQRLIRGLLYGRKDSSAKARARVGLAIVAFAAIYAVIGGRLVMFAVGALRPMVTVPNCAVRVPAVVSIKSTGESLA